MIFGNGKMYFEIFWGGRMVSRRYSEGQKSNKKFRSIDRAVVI